MASLAGKLRAEYTIATFFLINSKYFTIILHGNRLIFR
jgi:hypothetical protein